MARRTPLRAFAVLLLAVLVAFAWWYIDHAQREIWRFNFAPAEGPGVQGFVRVSGATSYTPWRGYGWLGDEATPLSGRWPGDSFNSWETRGRLNLLARRSPDDLARSFASSGADFAVDLPPGRYQVWVLSGDAGHLEYTPLLPYRILVNEREVYRYGQGAAQFRQQYESPAQLDDLSHDAVWRHYIEPRFAWSHIVVDVEQDPLVLRVEGEPWEAGLNLAGDYPYTEGGRGPAQRSAGAVNALVIVSANEHDSSGAREIARIDDWRRRNMAGKWPLQEKGDDSAQALIASERPYHVYIPDLMESIPVHELLPHQPGAISLRATPGETVCLSVVVSPQLQLGETRVVLDQLVGTSGQPVIAAGLSGAVVRYAARRVQSSEPLWQPVASEILPLRSWPVAAGVNRQFWFSFKLPAELAPGHYQGNLRVEPEHGDATSVAVAVEVLPFTLQRPDDMTLGLTYFSPVQDGWFDENDFWQRLTAEFVDMRQQGFTTVQFTGIGLDDYDRLDRVMASYRSAGFEQPLVLLESYGAMDRLRRDGITWDSEEFFRRYRQTIANLLAEGERRGWPQLIINFGDEFTNSGLEDFGARVARSLRQIPGIVTSADSNGYKEVELLAPLVDILAFNNGWAGPDRVNGDRKLLNRHTVKRVRDAGAEPWLVNVGTDRFSNGYWLWKMARLGVRGKLEWMYRGYNGMPHNGFDAVPLKTSLVLPGADGAVIHTLEYQRMRMGLDDLAYLNTLEYVLAREERAVEPDRAAIVAAQALLEELAVLIDDDYNYYLDDPSRLWPASRYREQRNRVIDAILAFRP